MIKGKRKGGKAGGTHTPKKRGVAGCGLRVDFNSGEKNKDKINNKRLLLIL